MDNQGIMVDAWDFSLVQSVPVPLRSTRPPTKWLGLQDTCPRSKAYGAQSLLFTYA